jgi:hypothetical protein
MPAKKNPDDSTSRQSGDEGEEIEIPATGEVTVETTKQPPRAPKGKKIHPRRPLPAVPEDGGDKQ